MLASTPERAARTPMRTGPVCATAGALTSELAASALPESFRKSLRFFFIAFPPSGCFYRVTKKTVIPTRAPTSQYRASGRRAHSEFCRAGRSLRFAAPRPGMTFPLFRGLRSRALPQNVEILENAHELRAVLGIEHAQRTPRRTHRAPHQI